MIPYLSEFGQLYAALAAACPALDGDLCQFSALPLCADWADGGRRSLYADLVSPTRDGFYHVGAARVSQSCRDLLESLDPVAGEGLEPRVRAALAAQPSEQLVGGDLAGDLDRWAAAQTPALQVEVDSSQPCDNAWTRLAGGGEGTGLSSLLGTACRYTFSAAGLGICEIGRGAWYDPELIQPSFPLVFGGQLRSDYFFGPGGSLQHIPLRLVVVWKPEIRFYMPIPVLRESHLRSARRPGGGSGLLGLDLDLGLAQVLPMANDALDAAPPDTVPVVVRSRPAPQLWAVSSRRLYLS